MIIACPECTKPFEVEDSEIAPLVQIECPHCVFRMILDFEAANDASLIEAGMQMAQGFSSEAEYRTAVGAGEVSLSSSPAPRLAAVAEPALEPEPEPALQPEPEPRWTPAPRTPPVQPASEKPPVRQPPVSLPEPEPEPEKPPVRIHRATFEPAPEPAPTEPRPAEPRPAETPTFVPESRSRPTLIAVSAPPPALRPPVRPAEPEGDVEVDLVDMDSGDREPVLPSPDARHTPPHTPPIVPPVARPEIEEPSRPAADSQSKPIERSPVAALDDSIKPVPKPSALGTVLKVLLLLLLLGVAGVMVWSLIETSSPNPLPMLQEKFGISL